MKEKGDNKAAAIDLKDLPRHIGIIMDGNGRWAKKRGLMRSMGHAAGSETFRRMARYCKKIGIEYLTVYAFSTENWKRPMEEVSAIMGLLEKYLKEAIEKMEKDQISIHIIGSRKGLPPRLIQLIDSVESAAQAVQGGLWTNICVNYGGREEIVSAAKELAQEVRAGRLTPEEIDEAVFARHLYTGGMPEPDLIIRPGGEVRTSNFLLYQSAYAEYYFTETLWPDFGPEDIDGAIASFQRRMRRYGRVVE